MPRTKKEQNELTDVQKELQELRQDIHSLSKAVGNNGKSAVQARLEEFKEQLHETSEELTNRLRDGWDRTYEQARENAEHAAERSREEVKARPLTMVLSAFAAGAIVSLLFRRS